MCGRVVPWHPPPTVWTVLNKRLCQRGRGRLCPGAVSALSCEVLGVPRPQEMWGRSGSHRSEFTSVIYGFVLLLSTPTLVCVLQTPGCISGPTPVLSTPRETPPGGSHLLLSASGPLRALGLQAA